MAFPDQILLLCGIPNFEIGCHSSDDNSRGTGNQGSMAPRSRIIAYKRGLVGGLPTR